jgi:hypothetical protein
MLRLLTTRTFAACVVLASVGANAASAQFAVGVKASTLGIGGEGAFHLTGPLVLRASINSYSVNQTSEEEGITYDIKAQLRGTPVMIDLHPTKGAFRLTAGMVFNTPRVTLNAQNTGTIEIGDQSYDTSDISSLQGSISGKKNAPYLGLGFDKSVFAKGRIAFGFELGVVMIGSPDPVLTPVTTLTGEAKAQLEASIEAELVELRAKIADVPTGAKYFPMVGFSLKIRM